jgi:hypothetical protein
VRVADTAAEMGEVVAEITHDRPSYRPSKFRPVH